jgi:alkanesulfonate monooxygenase SsuD/methylene tetrahydromethanopterin reductase-like flavin-dependent oxidoreductase (luciferase family)
VPLSERVSRFTEAVEIIRRLWSEDRVTHSGRHWQFSEAAIAPRPLRAPRPPIIIGAQVDAAIARAAKIGDGWLVVPLPTLDQLNAQMSVFKSARSATKLPPAEHFCRLLEVGCAADDDTAIRRSAPDSHSIRTPPPSNSSARGRLSGSRWARPRVSSICWSPNIAAASTTSRCG